MPFQQYPAGTILPSGLQCEGSGVVVVAADGVTTLPLLPKLVSSAPLALKREAEVPSAEKHSPL